MNNSISKASNYKTLFGKYLATEVEQAYVRVVMFALAILYFIWVEKYYIEADIQLYLYIYIVTASVTALVTLYLVTVYARLRPHLRAFHLFFDSFMALVAYFILGKYASPIFFTYLFVSIGYGMRYSLKYLIAGMTIGVIFHTIGIVFTGYDPIWPDVVRDYILLVILVAYTGILVKRLNTAYKDTEEALAKAEAASRAKTMFLANISHDLRTPLVGVGTAAELMDTNGWDEENKNLLNTISASSNVLEQQIELILEFAKSDSGRLELYLEPVSIDSILEDCKSIFGPQATKKGIALNINNATPGCLDCTEAGLRKIFINMVGNAIKFTNEGKVNVDVYHKDDNLNIEISDTGIGIPGDKLNIIFDPFTQADGSITRKYGGTGLGTAITKQLVEDLGGIIKMDSVEGEGTKVWINIPTKILDISQCIQENIFSDETLEDNTAARILVADDNITNRHVVKLVLIKGGFNNYEVVEDGAQALNKMMEIDYDLVILDRHMPEMDGGTVLSEYKKRKKKTVKAIFLTADQTDDAYHEYEKVGFDAFVKKPFKPADLLDVVNGVLSKT